MALGERFWSKVNKTQDCWLWTAGTHVQGYGVIWDSSRKASGLAHRLAYEDYIGRRLPREIGLDHRCHTEACVRPAHLRETSQKQNMENRKGANSNSKSGVLGVYWDSRKGKWRASVVHRGKRIYAGSHETLEAAEQAVVAKRNELFTHNDADRT